MKIYNDLVQGSEEWISVRLGKLTASHAQAIAQNGKGLETLAFEKATELLTNKPIDSFKNEAMEYGNQTESEARESYELKTGNTVEQVGFVELDEYVGASPDGLVGDDGLIEIKCPTPRVFTEYLYSGKVDPKYYAQMQMQMYVTDRLWCDYCVYHPDFTSGLIIRRIERDNELIEKLKVGLENGVKRVKEIVDKCQWVK